MARKPVVELITHDGSFHADEVMASAILLDLFPQADLIRTRDAGMTSAAPGRIVYDVGGIHDPEQMLFDHHQNGAMQRSCGTTYSAFGLIWREFGRDWLTDRVLPEIVEDVFQTVDRKIVLPVDAVDNGHMAPASAGMLEATTLFSMIGDFYPHWRDADEITMNDGFDAACRFARGFLERRVSSIAARLEAGVLVSKAIEESGGSPILVLPCSMPWQTPVLKPAGRDIRFVIHPRDNGEWVVSTVPVSAGSYDTRLDLPKNWAGLMDEELQTASGIKSAIFCHKARFMAVTGNREDAILMAEMALSHDPDHPEPA